MNEEKLLNEYIAWIMSHSDPDYTLNNTNDDHQTIIAETPYAKAYVSFTHLMQIIVEMKIFAVGSDDEDFYIHFEFKDIIHAEELFDEMILSLKKMKDQKKVKIVIVCSSALTSTFFAEKMNRAAELAGYNYTFSALSYDRLYKYGFDNDIVLLAPQISYMADRMAEIMKNSVVRKIPAGIFGTYDVKGLMTLVERSAEEKKNREYGSDPLSLKGIHVSGRVLVISVICDYKGKQFIYRVYHKGEIEAEDRILKASYGIRDIEDIIDVVMSMHDVDKIVVCTPGVVKNGRLTFHESMIIDYDADHIFTEKFHRPVTFFNDANAMALGWHSMQDRYSSAVFYFHPHAARICGTGIIINNQLNAGHNAIAGEMQFLVKALKWSDDPAKLAGTPEGSLELVTGYLTALISCLDPEAVVVYCDMVPDMGELQTSIGQYIRKDCIPVLIKVDDVVEYMFAGGLAYIAEKKQTA